MNAIRTIALDFIETYQKSMTMEEVESLFGKTDLIWQDFELYKEFSTLAMGGFSFPHQEIDLGNGWSPERTKRRGRQFISPGTDRRKFC